MLSNIQKSTLFQSIVLLFLNIIFFFLYLFIIGVFGGSFLEIHLFTNDAFGEMINSLLFPAVIVLTITPVTAGIFVGHIFVIRKKSRVALGTALLLFFSGVITGNIINIAENELDQSIFYSAIFGGIVLYNFFVHQIFIEETKETATRNKRLTKKSFIALSIIILFLISLYFLEKFYPKPSPAEIKAQSDLEYETCFNECMQKSASFAGTTSPSKTSLNCSLQCSAIDFKPVIYLYPMKRERVKVGLEYKGTIIADYPEYDYSKKGWEVIAYPDGRLINLTDNREYSYLFWEGIPEKRIDYDLSTGFVVKGEDTKRFLQEALAKIGLTPKEYNEFIVYWYPLMKDNEYNLIHFAGEEYTDTAKLEITPKPDSILRVFMVYKPLDKKIDIMPQGIKPFERKGFTVVEWGGSDLK